MLNGTMACRYQLPPKPHQPSNFKFPARTYGRRQRFFQPAWFASWPWLHYDEGLDAAFCHTCATAEQEGKLKCSNKEDSFLSKGYSNWKDATASFRKHEQSKCHKDAVQVMVVLPKTTHNIGDTLSTIHANEKAENRKILLKIIQNLRFLGRQGIALRGHDDSESNFMQLLKLRGNDDPHIHDWISRKTSKYISPEIQNELLQTMALNILRGIAHDLQSTPYFTLMADECTDLSNNEQLVLCFRWVDNHLDVHEEFTGLYHVTDTSALTLATVIEDCLLRLNLKLNRCRGQCYDAAGAMAGSKNGLAARILSQEPKALYTHCYGHSLNLAVCDTVKNCKILQDALATTFEIGKLLKYSPKRDAMFHELKKQLAPDTPGFRVLCPTRWTVRANSLQSVLDNYAVLQGLWESTLELKLDPEVKSRVIGVKAQMMTFDFFFGVCLGERTMKHADNLSKTLQSCTISAAEGQRVAALTVATLEGMRTEESFELFWKLVEKKASDLEISEPKLPRQRKTPKRLETGLGEPYFPQTAKELYRRFYYEVLDLTIASIQKRFDQPGFRTYKNLQNLLIKAANQESFEDEFKSVTTFYDTDVQPSTLHVQLDTLSQHFSSSTSKVDLQDIINFLKQFSIPERQIFSQVETIIKLILVNPSTNAISERSFSSMRRIKTFLRTTMTQERLNSVMILHIHKDKTDRLSLVDIANEFVTNERRSSQFGKFLLSDLHT